MVVRHESELRKAIRSWREYHQGLVSFIEPARGSDIGVADCMFTARGRLVPIELKRGNSLLNNLRPSQRSWHRTQINSGVQTYGLVLRPYGGVTLLQLSLSGGISSELQENFLTEFHGLEQMSYDHIVALFQ